MERRRDPEAQRRDYRCDPGDRADRGAAVVEAAAVHLQARGLYAPLAKIAICKQINDNSELT